MKRRILKNWVVNVLIVINIIMIIIASGECENMTIFILSKLISIIIILFNTFILSKYSTLFDED